MTAPIRKAPRIYMTLLSSWIALTATFTAKADVLEFVCVGQESVYTETFKEHQENLIRRSATVKVTVDREKKTLRLSGTKNADGQGALEAASPFHSIFASKRVIYEVPFNYVEVYLPEAKNTLVVTTGTHRSLAEENAEGRLLFSGTCRLPARKS